jgi:LPS export ABC transporter protein LptC
MMQNNIFKYLFVSLTLLALSSFISSCESKFKEIQRFHTVSFFPASEAEEIRMQYIDSGRVKAILTGKKMLDYSNVAYPFTEFPEGAHLTFFDNSRNKNTVVADYAISYTKTELIDLKGNVVITMHDGKKLESDQLYYDQKNEWLYTEGKYKASTDKDNFTQGIRIDFDSKLNTIKAKNSYAESLQNE